jgi:hypothetical protein
VRAGGKVRGRGAHGELLLDLQLLATWAVCCSSVDMILYCHADVNVILQHSSMRHGATRGNYESLIIPAVLVHVCVRPKPALRLTCAHMMVVLLCAIPEGGAGPSTRSSSKARSWMGVGPSNRRTARGVTCHQVTTQRHNR